MAAAIRIKLADLLKIMAETPPARRQPAPAKTRQTSLDVRLDLDAIREYLQAGPARRSDLEMTFHMSRGTILHRLDLLRVAGEVVRLPDHSYQLADGQIENVRRVT